MICKYKSNKKFELVLGKSFVTFQMYLTIYYFKSNNSVMAELYGVRFTYCFRQCKLPSGNKVLKINHENKFSRCSGLFLLTSTSSHKKS